MTSEYKREYFCVRCLRFMGILPIYWELIDHIGAFEILAFRIIFSMIFMILLLVVGRKQREAFLRDVNQLFTHPVQLVAIIVADM